MKNAMRSLLLLFLLSLASCGSLRKTQRPNPKKSPVVEHELLNDKNEEINEAKGRSDGREANKIKNADKEQQDLMNFIKDWYGTPHRMGGTTKKGVDCSGFVIVAYREVFQRKFKGRRAEDLFAEMEIVKWENLESGDLVFFKVRGRRIDHVGIYVGDGNFAHTSSSRGVMISALDNPYWSRRYFKAGRYKP